MLPWIVAGYTFLRSTIHRTGNYIFGRRVRPRAGSVVSCGLSGVLDHSGVFVGGYSIVELEGEGDIRRIDADTFVTSSAIRHSTIYIACDEKTAVPLGARRVAQRAINNAGGKRDYNLILDNCHQFSSGCLSGNFENNDNFFWMLEDTIEERLNGGNSIAWKVWNHEEQSGEEPSHDGLDERLEEECGELDYELINQHRIAGDGSVREAIHDELRTWQEYAQHQLREKFAEATAKLQEVKDSLAQGNASAEDIKNDLRELKALDDLIDTEFWEKENSKEDNKKPLRAVIQAEWERSLQRLQNEWFEEEINRHRTLLREELDKRLIAMAEIAEVVKGLGLSVGALWNQSDGFSARTDAKELQKLADYLKNNEGVCRLAELLGRMRRQSESERLEKIQTTTHYTQTLPDPEAKTEIVGITQGRDLEHLLPQELELLSDPETEILFDLKYIESRLMRFDYAGTMEKSFEETKEETIKVTEQEKNGPMIICVDTSGSMGGEPETVAKAIAMSLALRAAQEKRDAYLISFSTGIKTYPLTSAQGLQGLLSFLQMSFGGGTDAAPALRHAVEMLETENYARADVLLVSDFDMPRLDDELQSKMNNARSRGCKFNALNIGSNRQNTITAGFDAEWHYDPRTTRIKEYHEQ